MAANDKSPALTSYGLYHSIARLSKGALIELVVDMNRIASGQADTVTDAEVERMIFESFSPIANARRDRIPTPKLQEHIQ